MTATTARPVPGPLANPDNVLTLWRDYIEAYPEATITDLSPASLLVGVGDYIDLQRDNPMFVRVAPRPGDDEKPIVRVGFILGFQVWLVRGRP